ncbi:MAG: site-specific DNA-methyltransferase [Clostridia bacterium]|nr:site-specific DNA-methyltransferase [Clostridia bacterium]
MNQSDTEKTLLKKITELEAELKKVKKQKKYGLVWEDKPEQIVEDCKHNVPILRLKEKKKGIDPVIITDKLKDENILIEGDNYHALSVLNYTHKGKIDVIYIDPPYNTGNNDFIYNDNIVDKEDSFRHSKWLSFMSSRLKLTKDLLKENGVMFISIDDNELFNLKILIDEIFGDGNFELLVWDKVTGNKNAGSGKMKITYRFRKDHEYIVCVYKNKEIIKFIKPTGIKEFKNDYGNIDNDPRGNWMSCEICKSEEKSIPNGKNFFTFTTPFNKKITRQWHYSQDELDELVKDNRIYFGNGNIIPRLKKFLDEESEITPTSILQKIASTTDGNRDSLKIDIPFDNPKPIELIKYLLNLVVQKNNKSIVLDFFAGSGTTGHAVLDLNKQDGGNRKFILCTNNENNICEEITYKRLNRAIIGYKNKKDENIDSLGGNLCYYKTALVDIKKLYNVSDQDKVNLTYQAGEMIGFKENTLNEIEKNDWWQIFEGNGKITAIYFKEDKEKLLKLVETLEKKNQPTSLYIFSWGKNEYKSEYSSSNIRVEDIPEPILEVYKEINCL